MWNNMWWCEHCGKWRSYKLWWVSFLNMCEAVVLSVVLCNCLSHNTLVLQKQVDKNKLSTRILFYLDSFGMKWTVQLLIISVCKAGYFMNGASCSLCTGNTIKPSAGNATSCEKQHVMLWVLSQVKTMQLVVRLFWYSGSNFNFNADILKTVIFLWGDEARG